MTNKLQHQRRSFGALVIMMALLCACTDAHLVYEPYCTEEHEEKLQAWVLDCVEKSEHGIVRDCRHAGEQVVCLKTAHVKYRPCTSCKSETVPCVEVRGTDLGSVCPVAPQY